LTLPGSSLSFTRELTNNAHFVRGAIALSESSAFVADAWAATGARRFAKNGKARITNGDHFLPGVDGRSTWVRRARDVHGMLITDKGGAEAVSVAETLIMRRAAVLESELERLELIFAKAGKAEPSELCLYQTCANAQRRLLETIGLERRSRDITPTLASFVADIEARKAAAEPVDAFFDSELSDPPGEPAERTGEPACPPAPPSSAEKGGRPAPGMSQIEAVDCRADGTIPKPRTKLATKPTTKLRTKFPGLVRKPRWPAGLRGFC
jgi:hypothetical protein